MFGNIATYDGHGAAGVGLTFATTTIATDPGERSFDNPSLGQDLEANDIGSLDNF